MNDCKLRKLFGRFMALSLVFCLILGLAGCGSGGTSNDSKDSSSSSEQDGDRRDNRDQDTEDNEAQEDEPDRKKQVVTGTTPEETLEVFLKALSEQDVDTMMACCYIDGYLDRVSFAQYVDRVRAYFPGGGISAPTEYDYYQELVRYEICATYARGFRVLAFSLLTADEEYEPLLEGMPIQSVDRQWAREFSREVDPEMLKNLEVLNIDADRPELQDQSREQLIQSSGADDWVERTVLLELDGQLFCKGFTLVEIDGRWQIQALNAIFLGENAYGAATQVESEQAYRDMIA